MSGYGLPPPLFGAESIRIAPLLQSRIRSYLAIERIMPLRRSRLPVFRLATPRSRGDRAHVRTVVAGPPRGRDALRRAAECLVDAAEDDEVAGVQAAEAGGAQHADLGEAGVTCLARRRRRPRPSRGLGHGGENDRV